MYAANFTQIFFQKHFLKVLYSSVGDSMVYEPPPVFLVDRAGAATWIITVGSGTSSGNLSNQTRTRAPEQWSVRQRQNCVHFTKHDVPQPSEPPVFIQTHSRLHIDRCLLRHREYINELYHHCYHAQVWEAGDGGEPRDLGGWAPGHGRVRVPGQLHQQDLQADHRTLGTGVTSFTTLFVLYLLELKVYLLNVRWWVKREM